MKIRNLFVKILIIGFVSLVMSCEKDESGQNSSGIDTLKTVNVNTTLDTTKIYVAVDAVQVYANLIIPPGTIIKFTSSGRIDVHEEGGIQAIGTVEKPIVFTSIKDDTKGGDINGDQAKSMPLPKDWGCITTGSDNSAFSYCLFYYGGGFGDHTATLDIRNCTASVTYCTFAYNYGGLLDDNTNGALCVKDADLDVVVNNNIFYANDIPLTIDVGMSMDTTNIFHSPLSAIVTNKYNGIFVDHYSNYGAVVWEENEVPFVMISHMGIEEFSSLTLNQDVVIKMYPDTRIDVKANASLDHNGAIITSFNDDANLGDTNGDGNSTSPVAGDWVGVNLGYGNYMTGGNILYSLH